MLEYLPSSQCVPSWWSGRYTARSQRSKIRPGDRALGAEAGKFKTSLILVIFGFLYVKHHPGSRNASWTRKLQAVREEWEEDGEQRTRFRREPQTTRRGEPDLGKVLTSISSLELVTEFTESYGATGSLLSRRLAQYYLLDGTQRCAGDMAGGQEAVDTRCHLVIE